MAEIKQVYKCEICGNIVEVVHGGVGKLVCCGKPMVEMVENTVDAAKEKHIPVIERDGHTVKVTVGSVLHPMEDKHYIEWIELNVGNKSSRKYLKPGETPVAEFCAPEGEAVAARAYCNLHGLWKS